LAAAAAAFLAARGWPQTTGLATDQEPTATIVAAPIVNARACPGLDCPIAFTLELGAEVRVTGTTENGWAPIARGDDEGWVWSQYARAAGEPAPWLIRGIQGCQRVAFLFNLGVGYQTRMELLEWMATERIPASIFPMGWWAEKEPETLRRMHELGFEIGSHGYDRFELPTLDDGAVLADIAAAELAIEAAIGDAIAPLFTPYAAASEERVRGLIAAAGYLPVGWEVPADDYGPDATAEYVFDRVLPNVVDGSIVEFHLDAPASAQSTVVAVPWIVERLRAKGFSFVTVSDVARPCPSGLPSATPAGATPAASPTSS
jgi:peptidoglycan/xylan/chitin deacetylase (PgdA/CDA1 family)